MRRYGLAIDPGMSTGACLFSWGDDEDQPFRQEKLWQFPGGAPMLGAFLRSIEMHQYRHPGGESELYVKVDGVELPLRVLVMEKFTPRPHETFSLTLKSVEPLRGEGVLIGMGFHDFIDWAEPSQQYFMGGSDLADKKKRSREFLKLNGIHVTGSMVGQKDADDAISAQLHAIAWLRRTRHGATLLDLFSPTTEEP